MWKPGASSLKRTRWPPRTRISKPNPIHESKRPRETNREAHLMFLGHARLSSALCRRWVFLEHLGGSFLPLFSVLFRLVAQRIGGSATPDDLVSLGIPEEDNELSRWDIAYGG